MDKVMCEGERQSALDENRFDRLFRGLLGIETQILKACLGNTDFGTRQVAPGSAQPLVWIGG